MVLNLRTPKFRNFTFAELREDVVVKLFNDSGIPITVYRVIQATHSFNNIKTHHTYTIQPIHQP